MFQVPPRRYSSRRDDPVWWPRLRVIYSDKNNGATVVSRLSRAAVWVLSCLVMTTGWSADPVRAQQPAVTYVYDDLGRLSRVVELGTGSCAAYEYDAVGNLVSISRQSNCLVAPSVTGISPAATQNCFVVAGQNLLGATVSADIPGVSTTDLAATPTSVNFCLSTQAPVCSLSGTVTVTTLGGSSPALPVTIVGAANWPGAIEFVDSLATSNRSDRFCFTLPAAQRIIVQATSLAFDPCLILTTDGGAAVAGGSACAFPAARLDLTLPAGSYFVDISDNGNTQVGAYTMVYEPIIAATAAPLIADVAVQESALPTGDLDLFMFTLTAPTRVILQATSLAIDPCVRLLTAAGDPPVTGGTACAFPAARLDLVLGAGTYFVETSDNGNTQSGDYTLLYEPVDTPTARPLTADVPVTDSVSPLGDLDLYMFTVTSSTRVVLQATSLAVDPCVRLLAPAGEAPVPNGSACAFPASRLDIVLPAGVYFVEVSDNGSSQTGAYTLIYEPIVLASATPLVADVPASDTVTPLGDLDLYTFTLTSSTRVVLQATSLAVDPCVRILAPAGEAPVPNGSACAFPASHLDIVLPAGVYFVEVSDNGSSQTGAYTLIYEPIVLASATPLVAGVPASDTLTPLGDLDLYTFTVTSSTRVVLQATSLAVDPCIRILAPAGEAPVPNGSACAFPASRLDIVLPAGVYFVEVSDNGSSQTGAYTLIYEPIVLASATPLVADVPASDTLTPLGDLDLYTFTLTSSTRVVLQATSLGVDPCVRLLAPAGEATVPNGSACAFPASRLDIVLPAGVYFVEVSDNGGGETGPYRLIYEPIVVENATVLASGIAAVESISPLGDLDLYTFTLPISTRVVLQASSNALDPCVRLLTGTGGPTLPPILECGFPSARVERGLDAGTYFVELSDNDNSSAGSYTLLLESDITAPPTVTIEATDPAAAELGLDPGAFTITRTGSTGASLAVNFTVGGTAGGGDYVDIGTTVIIPGGQASHVVQIAPFSDFELEPAESVVLTLAPGNYAIGTPSTATVTIADDGAPTVISVFTTTPTIAETGTNPGTFTIFRNGPLNSSLTVNLTLTGTATEGADYASVGTSIVMAPGELVASVSISPVADGLTEAAETVTLTIAPGNYTIAGDANTASITITDLPSATSVYVLTTWPTTFESGAIPAIFTVVRTGSISESLTVNLEWSGTAARGIDYEDPGITVVIPAGEESVSITITPIPDALDEGEEAVTVTLAPGAYAVVPANATANSAILDGAERPVVYVVAVDALASESGSDIGTLLIVRTDDFNTPLTVTYELSGTATSGVDFQSLPLSVVIPAGQVFANIDVLPIADSVAESPETLTLTITPGAYVLIELLRAATVTITDVAP